MPFSPPDFHILKQNTYRLEDRLSTILGRYKVTDNSRDERANSLTTLIDRTQEVLTCTTERATQKQVFDILVTELHNITTGSTDQIQKATMFLLGALIHRYFRIKSEYDTKAKKAVGMLSLGIFEFKPSHCSLYVAIEKALNLSENKLDSTTIVTCLEVFRDNMLIEDDKNKPRYTRYPHFAADNNFFPYLQEIIDKHKVMCKPIITQYNAIAFLKTLASSIDKRKQFIDEIIETWLGKIPSAVPWTIQALESQLEKTGALSDSDKKVLLELLLSPFIVNQFENLNANTLRAQLSECFVLQSRYVLFGGYTLVLNNPNALDKLRFCLRESLGVSEGSERLDSKDYGNSLKFLSYYLDKHTREQLNCSFFGGFDKMQTEMAQLKMHFVDEPYKINATPEAHTASMQ